MKQAVILAGGLGTRLRPITEKVPKVLVEVKGRPFLYWQLQFLKEQGVKDVLLLCAYLGEQIREKFRDGRDLNLNIDYSFEPEPLGTGGALKLARPQLAEEFFLFNGDSFLHIDMNGMREFYKKNSFDAVMSCFRELHQTVVPANLIVEEGAKGGAVRAYKKNAGDGYNAVDSGVYILKRKILDQPTVDQFALEDLWPDLMARGKLGAYFETEKFYDIGTVDRLKKFEETLSDYFPNAF